MLAVVVCATGIDPVVAELLRAGQPGQPVEIDAETDGRLGVCLRCLPGRQHLGCVAQQPKSGDVGGRVRAGGQRSLGRGPVELHHAGSGCGKLLVAGQVAHEGCGDHARAQRLGQDQPVAWLCAALGK